MSKRGIRGIFHIGQSCEGSPKENANVFCVMIFG
jgi:hypothetical protein